jgi:hypothetical protein
MENNDQQEEQREQHYIGLPVEIWREILLFFKRLYTPAYGTIPLVNRLFHQLTYPLMHEKNPHVSGIMSIIGDDQTPEGFHLVIGGRKMYVLKIKNKKDICKKWMGPRHTLIRFRVYIFKKN